MNNFKGKTAVITGAASGIGFAIAYRCASEGMKIVIADIEKSALKKAEEQLKSISSDVLAVLTDMSKEKDIEALAKITMDTYGEIHMLFNNAGVGAGSLIWESTVEDWQWTINVNLLSVIYAARIFVPIMLRQQTECYIINTASQAGLETGPFNGPYRVTKHGLVAFSETLYHELKLINSRINVSVLCPGFVKTKICDAHRNRPKDLYNTGEEEKSKKTIMVDQMMRAAVENGLSPEKVADITFESIGRKQFYILTDAGAKAEIRQRMENILNDLNPQYNVPVSFKR